MLLLLSWKHCLSLPKDLLVYKNLFYFQDLQYPFFQIESICTKLRASPDEGGLTIKDRYYHLKKYHVCFVGRSVAIDIPHLGEGGCSAKKSLQILDLWRLASLQYYNFPHFLAT